MQLAHACIASPSSNDARSRFVFHADLVRLRDERSQSQRPFRRMRSTSAVRRPGGPEREEPKAQGFECSGPDPSYDRALVGTSRSARVRRQASRAGAVAAPVGTGYPWRSCRSCRSWAPRRGLIPRRSATRCRGSNGHLSSLVGAQAHRRSAGAGRAHAIEGKSRRAGSMGAEWLVLPRGCRLRAQSHCREMAPTRPANEPKLGATT